MLLFSSKSCPTLWYCTIAARLSCPLLFPNFQARIPNKSLQEMELNSVPLLSVAWIQPLTNEQQTWYMTLMRLGYKKDGDLCVEFSCSPLCDLLTEEASCPGFKQTSLWEAPRGEALKFLVNSQRGIESANNPGLGAWKAQIPHPWLNLWWVYPRWECDWNFVKNLESEPYRQRRLRVWLSETMWDNAYLLF